MTSSGPAVCVVLLYLGVSSVLATPSVGKELKYEEYNVEHEISTTEARNNALSTDLNAIIVPAGCQECTKEEIQYCGSNLISDHCCCDKRFHEYLPYIPHTCYIGTQLCTPVATDCNEYTRLRICCCDKYLLQKWRHKYGASTAPSTSTKNILVILPILLSVVHIFVYLL